MGRDSRRLRLVVALLLLTSFTFLTLDSRSGHGTFGGARRIVGDIFGPIAHAVHGITAPVGRAFSAAIHSGRDKNKIRDLEKQITILNQNIASDTENQKARDSLRNLRYFESRSNSTITWAQVITHGASAVQDYQQTVVIDAGSMDGIRKDMYVVDATSGTGGLVGQIVEVSRSTSIVRLLIDKGFTVTVQSEDEGLTKPATITGQGPNVPLRLVVSDSQYAIKVGQRFGTKAVPSTDGFLPVPAAIPVGTVTRVTTQIGDNGATADVQPFFTPGALDYVGIVLTQGRDVPRIALPPTPSPQPASTSPSSPASASATPSAVGQSSHVVTPTSPAAPPPTTPSAPRTSAPPSRPPSSPATHSPSPSVHKSASPSKVPSSAPRSSARSSPPASSSPKP
ncbi:MAG TPA: rod shape-determining protein MreC [Mycobacteriales bacterium]|nr:rod shape-determining protein MreC [Mycobacteriales bacterium]